MPYKNKRWKPNKTQAKEFATRMKTDPSFAEDYNRRKIAKADKRRAGSKFEYASAGGEYVPTKEQHNAAFKALGMPELNLSQEQRIACEMVMSAYSVDMKVHHDQIHIVNELRRNNSCLG